MNEEQEQKSLKVLGCGHDNDFAHVVKVIVEEILSASGGLGILVVSSSIWSELENIIIFSVQALFEELGAEQPKLPNMLSGSKIFGRAEQLEAMWKLQQAAKSTAIN